MNIEILLNRLARPAQRAIASTEAATLEDLAKMRAAEVANLHGIGKNAMKIIVATLDEHGLSLAESSSSKGKK